MKWEIRFEPRDLWVGLYWDLRDQEIRVPLQAHVQRYTELHLYWIVVPTLVLHGVGRPAPWLLRQLRRFQPSRLVG